MLTALQPRSFLDAARKKIKCEDDGKDPDRVLEIMDDTRLKYVHHADIDVENEAAGRDDGRRDSKPGTKKVEGRHTWESQPAAMRVGSKHSMVSDNGC